MARTGELKGLSDPGFEALGRLKRVAKSLNGRSGSPQLLWIGLVPGDLRVDVLHPKQLIIDKFQKLLQLFEGELNGQFLHLKTILSR